jgi:hypothetical protein
VSVTSDIHHFFELRVFKILYSNFFKIYDMLLSVGHPIV